MGQEVRPLHLSPPRMPFDELFAQVGLRYLMALLSQPEALSCFL